MTSADTGSMWDRPTVPPTLLVPGDQLGRFRIEELIGRGGMGEVWKAHDPVRNNWVVIKVLPREMLQDPENLERLRDSFRQIQGFQHQHICPVYDLNPDERAGWYLVMKFVEGTTLSYYQHRTLKDAGTFPVSRVMSILQPIASALDYAHQQGVIHRDVKPQNIMVSADGSNPQLVDFGLAATIHRSMSRAGNGGLEISGSYPYMAPEQWKGSPQDGRTDQYALAVVAYELLGGHPPFDSPDASVMRMCVLQDSPPAIEALSDAANRSLRRALAKVPSERYGSCQEFLVDLSAALSKSAGSGRAATLANAAPRTPVKSDRPDLPQQNRKEMIFTAALLAAVCVMGWLFRGDLLPKPATNPPLPAVTTPATPLTGTPAPATLPASTPASTSVASAGTGIASSSPPTLSPIPTPPMPVPMPASPSLVTNTTPSRVQPSSPPANVPTMPTTTAPTPTTTKTASAPVTGTAPPAPKPTVSKQQMLADLNEARVGAERAKQDSQNRNADQYAARTWNAADADKKVADELYSQGNFSESLIKYRAAARGYYQAVTVADGAMRLASNTQKTLERLKTRKAQLLEQKADMLVPKEFQAAAQAHDNFLQAMQSRDYGAAADALATAETGYEQCLQRAVELSRVRAAQSEFDQIVSALDPQLLNQYGGQKWSDAIRELTAARAADNTPRLELALATATKLLPDIREKIQDSEVDKWKTQGDHTKILDLLWPSWSQLKPPARKLALDAARKVPGWWLKRAEAMQKDASLNPFQASLVELKLADACYRTPGHSGSEQHVKQALKFARNVTDPAGSKSAYLGSWISLEIAEDCLRRGDLAHATAAAKQTLLDLESMAEPPEPVEKQVRRVYKYSTMLRCAAVYWAVGDKAIADATAERAYVMYTRPPNSSSFYWDLPVFQAIFVYANSGDEVALAKMKRFFDGGTIRLSHIAGQRKYQSMLDPAAFSEEGHSASPSIDFFQMLDHAEMAIRSARVRQQDEFDLHRRKVEAMLEGFHSGDQINSWYQTEIHCRIAIADAMQGDVDSAMARMLNKSKISQQGQRGSTRATVGRLCAEHKRFDEARQLHDDGADDSRTILLAFDIARLEGAENLEATLDWLAALKTPAHQAAGLAGLSTIPAH